MALAAIALCGVAMHFWSGVWRMLAAIPIITTVAPMVRVFIRIDHDPEVYNLWPLSILLWSILSALLLGAIRLAKGLAEGRATRRLQAQAQSEA